MWARCVYPPSAIYVAAAAAILVLVGSGLAPTTPRVGSVARAGVHLQTRAPVRGRGSVRTDQWLRQFKAAAPPPLDRPGSQTIGGRYLPSGVYGHDAWLIAYDVPIDNRRVVLSMLVIDNVQPDELSEGERVEIDGRVLRVIQADGHTAVTTIDAAHRGYMFMAEDLTIDELVHLVGRTGLVGSP